MPEVVIRNSEERVLGRVTATEALAYSLNTIIAEIAVDRIGPNAFYEYLFKFGLGEVSGIDLAHEFNGSLKDKYPGTEYWNITDPGDKQFWPRSESHPYPNGQRYQHSSQWRGP